jgi:casein kinase I family protein HRR25
MQNTPNFAKIYDYGKKDEYYYLVMTYLGQNIETLLKKCGGHFSIKTTAMLGY